MLTPFIIHNGFQESLTHFTQTDPHLAALAQLQYQHSADWWKTLSFDIPGIYILTGGRQVGKSTSCKLLIQSCLKKKIFTANNILYLPCDEIFDATELSKIIHYYLDEAIDGKFLLIIDEITFVKDWDRVIKSLADAGYFQNGLCILTGSDTLILKEAAMRFPGRRGKAEKVDFHLYPLSFFEYVKLIKKKEKINIDQLSDLFRKFLQCGGYLRAINDLATQKKITNATYLTYEQWIRGDFLKQGKNEEYLIALLQALVTIGVSPISYSSLTQKIGLLSKETCIDYCRLLKRMDILITLQAFDQNKKQGFPRKDQKFHFIDPFIYQTIHNWLIREGYVTAPLNIGNLVEATAASHCYRQSKTYYFKGQGEVDIIRLINRKIQAIEIKWSEQLRSNDFKTLKQFKNALILNKRAHTGTIENIATMAVYQFLYESITVDHPV